LLRGSADDRVRRSDADDVGGAAEGEALDGAYHSMLPTAAAA
jgi:hypothetical protein